MIKVLDGTYLCIYFRTSIARMREAVKECGIMQWPEMVDIEIGDDEVDFPAQINFEPSKGGLSLSQFMQITASAMRRSKHDGEYDFGIHASSDNPRFFYPSGRRNGNPELGGFHLDENKVQGEAVMRLNKIREIVG